MQIDDPSRGFSYKVDGPLDLRMDPTHGVAAAERLRELTKEELIGLFQENADEPHAEEIAEKIVRKLSKGEKIETTFALRDVIKEALCRLPAKEREEEARKACQRCFQALRIDINGEFEALYSLLEKLPDALNPGGRVAILTFHSGEDRLVKKALKEGERNGIYSEISKDVTRPSAQECFRNPRAKSTKLRYAVKS
jgi:16S rRNA (cytosine1402-N4)-methyltransferase